MAYDRRIPRITVQQLRRDLREADADRFRLTVVEPARAAGRRKLYALSLAFLLTAGVGSALSVARAPEPETVVGAGQQTSAKPVEVVVTTPPIVEVVSRADTVPSRGRVKPVVTVPRAATRRLAPRDMEHLVRTGGDERQVRAVPRPRHPGEFGRAPRQ
jgi:hypothetical protein